MMLEKKKKKTYISLGSTLRLRNAGGLRWSLARPSPVAPTTNSTSESCIELAIENTLVD